MVMRNRHNEPNPDGWWDDLPPSVKKRVPRPTRTFDPRAAEVPEPQPNRPNVASDLSRLAMLFLAVAVGNILFLLIALSFLSGNPLFVR